MLVKTYQNFERELRFNIKNIRKTKEKIYYSNIINT